MRITDSRAGTKIALTKSEAGRLQDAAYIVKRIAQIAARDQLLPTATMLRSLVEQYAPQHLEAASEDETPAKETEMVRPPAGWKGM